MTSRGSGNLITITNNGGVGVVRTQADIQTGGIPLSRRNGSFTLLNEAPGQLVGGTQGVLFDNVGQLRNSGLISGGDTGAWMQNGGWIFNGANGTLRG